ncbi:MAG: phosphohistidine phosphatase SixA [Planctomycetota bacterium]
MLLYILRHGKAGTREEWHGDDAARPLTDEGKQRTQAVLEALRDKKKLEVEAIWTSPLVRARQTAEIAGQVLGVQVSTLGALACGATLASLQAALRKKAPLPESVMLVGHEPDCGALIGELAGDPQGDYTLKKAGIAALKGRFETGGMVLKWKLAPKDVIED